MKIVYLCCDPGVPVFGRKGCSTHVRETCIALQELGHELRLVCTNVEGDDADRDRIPVESVEPYRARQLGFDLRHILVDRRMERAAARLVREWGAEAIYERYSLYSRTGVRLARRLGLPHLLEVNALMTREQADRIRLAPLARVVERGIMRGAREVTVVSEQLRGELAELRGSTDHITRMPMAVNLAQFHPGIDSTDLKRELGLERKFVIGYIGTLTAWHGIALLFDLAKAIRKREAGEFAILVVGGDDRRIAANRERVKAEGLEDCLVFNGAVPYSEVPRYVRTMDLALVPDTTPWSSPAKMFEYQGCGVPVLAPRYPAIENVIVDGESGFLFEPRQIDQMADRVLEAMRDPERLRRMGKAARAHAEADHSWDARARTIVEIFERQRRG